jgi:hypothetical protein
MTLEDQIRNLLTTAGFASFEVIEGVGATVGVYADVASGERSLLLAAYAVPLRAHGLIVEQRADYLYVDKLASK